MELTKEQIQYIDHRLENEGVKYWDIRIEMLDHIISDVEKNLKPENTEYEFKEIVQTSFVSLGWKENFNGGGFEKFNKQGWKNTNKFYRKMYFQEFVAFFRKPRNIIILFFSLCIYYFLSEFLNHKTFIKVSYGLFASPMLLYLYVFFKVWKKKYGKSVHRDYGLNYLLLSFFILNAFMQFIRLEDGFPVEFHKPLLFIIVPCHLILTFSGYQVYKKAITRVEKMRKELST